MSPGLSVALPSPTAASASFTPAPTPAGHSHASSSSSVFNFRSSTIAPMTRPISPPSISPFQVMDEEDEERMRQIQQLAKRRRSSLLRPDNTSAYSIPSPVSATSLHTSFAQLSLRPPPQQQSIAATELPAPRMPTSARRLFSLDVASEGRESSRSSKKGSLKRAHDDDEDDHYFSQHRTTDDDHSPTTHVEEEHKQQEPEPQPVVASRGLFDKRTLRERPRRWTTGLVTAQDSASNDSEQPRAAAARPITPYVSNAAHQPIKPVPRSLFLQTTDEDIDDSSDNTRFSFDLHTAAPPIKRSSLTSSSGNTSFLPLPPQSRPPTPLAAIGKRSTLPATFRLSSLASLAESISARNDDADEEDDKRGAGREEAAVVDERQQAVASEKAAVSSVFTWSSALPPVGGEFRLSRAGSNEGRRRSLAIAGARALVGGVQF